MLNEGRIDLLERAPLLKRLLKARAFQPAMMLATLLVFTLAILAGIAGTPAGSRNFGIVFVWIVWWALLIVVLVPFFGRLWCTICPIPAPGEWLQRRAIVRRGAARLWTRGLRWPRRLKNMWLQNFGFLAVALFSTIILTRPGVSAWLLLSFLLAGVLLSALYKNRVFCRYVCPVGGFIGLYSLVSPVELRVADPNVCADHKTKDCITGNEFGYGCPWMVFPGSLTRNAYCGLCFECLKTCPKNNIVLNLRPFGSDLTVAKERRLDEAYKAFIMLGCALLYSAVLLGPWGWLKDWANMDTLPHWALYAASFLSANLVLLPGLFGLSVWIGRSASGSGQPLRRLFVDYAYTLIPLGLAAWIAFSTGFVLVNGSYALTVLSDPFGWGWDLFGTAGMHWTPLGATIIPFLQVGVLTAGLMAALNTAYKIARQHGIPHRAAFVEALPVSGFALVVTVGFLRLYLG
ncbi:4Fe-4S binding protein [Aggregatilinea lenta]|uniref:4Fe-4S binding protein n=1 Tax=Aggregatilinea lenta TaxID=913108 RepID=UPI000E5ADC1C|nr:4Fe-4S binding protein [Aggregatilinea lenta]